MRSEKSAPGALLLNLLLLYIVYGITRLAFFLENYATYEHLVGADGWWSIVVGGLYFDTSAIAYTNALYVLLVLLPIPQKEGPLWQRICKWLFVVVNSLGLAMNLGDSVYFQYTARRTTIAFFPRVATVPRRRYYLSQCVSLLIAAYAVFAGIRGGLWDNRPIKISTANQFIIKPNDASLILNTPFTMIRTIGHSSYHNPAYFTSNSELESIYSPLHTPVADSTSQKKDIVVIFLESFGREYVGSLNSEVLPGYKGYTPFLDSLMQQAVSFRYTYANGRSSVDAMPSSLSGLPMFVESFVAASHATNHLEGVASCLSQMGYQTAFFHGAPASSLGFQGFTRSTGFQQCFAQEDYEADSRTRGAADSDNWWGIWDEPFLQYFRMKMSDMQEPFMTALFTLTSHHPFHIPEQYAKTFPEEELPIHKCIRYTDHALSRFFREAAKEPWFRNTLFIMTGDHTNMSNHAEYKSGINQFSTTIIVYDPSGQLKPGIREYPRGDCPADRHHAHHPRLRRLQPSIRGLRQRSLPYPCSRHLGGKLSRRRLSVLQRRLRTAVRRPTDHRRLSPHGLPHAAQPQGAVPGAATDGARGEGHHPTIHATHDR